MEANDDRVAAALSGSVLRASGADLVLAEWRDPGGGTEPPPPSRRCAATDGTAR